MFTNEKARKLRTSLPRIEKLETRQLTAANVLHGALIEELVLDELGPTLITPGWEGSSPRQDGTETERTGRQGWHVPELDSGETTATDLQKRTDIDCEGCTIYGSMRPPC